MRLFRCFNKIIQCAHKKTIDWKTTCDMHSFIFLDRLTDKGDKRSEIIYSQAWSSWLPSFCHGFQYSSHNFRFQFWLPWASMADAQPFWRLYLLYSYLVSTKEARQGTVIWAWSVTMEHFGWPKRKSGGGQLSISPVNQSINTCWFSLPTETCSLPSLPFGYIYYVM